MKTNKRSIKMYGGDDKLFLAAWRIACGLPNAQPSRRQHRKWEQKRGSAYACKNAAQKELGQASE